MINAAFEFWFNDKDHVRSPFPYYIRENLRISAIDKFLNWSSEISEKAKKDINDEILAEKLEEIIFELALDMVLTEDEKFRAKEDLQKIIGEVNTNLENIFEKKEKEVMG